MTNNIKFGSVCSGIEAASVAFHELGWEAAWFSEIEKFPCAVLEHHYPTVPNHGDMTLLPDSILNREIEAPDVFVGGTPCFPEDVLILTTNGLVPIKDVVVGDLVLTHKQQFKKVLKVGNKVADTIILKGCGVSSLETTPEHPFYVKGMNRIWCPTEKKSIRNFGALSWKEAKDIIGDYWCTPTSVPSLEIPNIECLYAEGKNLENFDITSTDWFTFMGRWVGDGWTITSKRPNRVNSYRGNLIICCGKHELDTVTKLFDNVHLPYTISEERTTYRFTICSLPLTRWVESNFGKYSYGKQLPGWLYGCDIRLIQAFLDGYYSADGHYTLDKKVQSLSSINKGLIYGVRILESICGKTSSILKTTPNRICIIEGRTVKEQPSYRLSVYNTPRSSVFLDDFQLGRVKKIIEGSSKVVYNLEVEDDNSYIADGIVVHNCQAFSVAGKRKSLDDYRGNLSLTFCEIANSIDTIRKQDGKQESIIFWENVPGVLNTTDNAFGCFLAELAGEDMPLQPAGKKWTNSGVVLGPKRAVAWRILDAQYFGLAQRRKRVFVVASARSWFDPTKILFEFEGLRRDIAPSRPKGQKTTGYVESSFGGYREDPIAGTLKASGGVASGGSETFLVDIVGTLDTDCGCSKLSHQSAVSGHLIPIMSVFGMDGDSMAEIVGTLTTREGVISDTAHCVAIVGNIIGRKPENGGNGNGFAEDELMYTLTATDVPDTAYSLDSLSSNSMKSKNPDSGYNEVDLCKTIDTSGINPTCNQGGIAIVDNIPYEGGGKGYLGQDELTYTISTSQDQHLLDSPKCFQQNTRDEVRYINADGSLAGALCSNSGMKQTNYVHQNMHVRKLTPEECEKLQGFPVGYTKIPYNKKTIDDCPDGPRYKAIGNSWAVPVITWIGKRIVDFLDNTDNNSILVEHTVNSKII